MDYKEFYRKSSEAETLILILRSTLQMPLLKNKHIPQNFYLLSALDQMLSTSSRLARWSFHMKELNYSLSFSETSSIQQILMDNSFSANRQKINVERVAQHTNFTGDVDELVQNITDFIILQDDMMQTITASYFSTNNGLELSL